MPLNSSVQVATLQVILPWRDQYRQEMGCQIIHDSIHYREGWTREYLIREGDVVVGYGSLAIAGPWRDKPTIYEFFVSPRHRNRVFQHFESLLNASGAVMIEVQSNDPLITVMLHLFCTDVETESILFKDQYETSHSPRGARFRAVMAEDQGEIESQKLDSSAKWLVELDGSIAATGGILFHYNRPYGDIFMHVAETFRQRGPGSFLVQELKRVCYEEGCVPGARCNPGNIASRKTLQKAGFVPCGHILHGTVGQESRRAIARPRERF